MSARPDRFTGIVTTRIQRLRDELRIRSGLQGVGYFSGGQVRFLLDIFAEGTSSVRLRFETDLGLVFLIEFFSDGSDLPVFELRTLI